MKNKKHVGVIAIFVSIVDAVAIASVVAIFVSIIDAVDLRWNPRSPSIS